MSSPDLDLERRLAALRELLRGLFDGEQLRRFLVTLPGGSQLSDELPGVNASFAALFHETTLLLNRWRLVDGELFNALVRARPTARVEIERVAALWSLGVTTRARIRGAPSLVGADDPSERAANELRELRNKLSVLKSRGLPTAALEQAIREKARALQAGRSVAVGDTLAEGRYLIVEKLGSGGFATVWRAWDDEKQREVAIKALKGELAGERSRRERFQRGARLMAGLVHPHIVRVYDEARVEGGLHYVVMELLSGGDLHERVLSGTYDRATALAAVLGVGDALAFAHSKGIVHRDVKPHNILIDEGGGAKLTDFDLGRDESGTRDTGTAASMGTLMYAAPESLGNAREVGSEGDIASLAMTAAFCIYGADLPPDSLYRRDRFFAKLDCSEAVRAVLVRASEHEPKDRYPSARAFCDALKAALGTPVAPAMLVASPGAPVEAPAAPRVSGAVWTPPVAHRPEPSTTPPPVAPIVAVTTPVVPAARAVPPVVAPPIAQRPVLRPPIAQGPPVSALPVVSQPVVSQPVVSQPVVPQPAAMAPAPVASVPSIYDLPRPAPRKEAAPLAAALAAVALPPDGPAAPVQPQDHPSPDPSTPPASAPMPQVASNERVAPSPPPVVSEHAPLESDGAARRRHRRLLGAGLGGLGVLVAVLIAAGDRQGPDPVAEDPNPQVRQGPTGASWRGTLGLSFLELSQGQFQMGSPDGLGEADERPVHSVQVSGFLLSQTEVTQSQWASIIPSPVWTATGKVLLDSAPWKFAGGGLPVESVSWCNALRFANALSRSESLTPAYVVGLDCETGGEIQWDTEADGFRLPTEAEWEYAARAGTSNLYSTGDTEADLASSAWYEGNSGGKTHEVCTTESKPWGFCDLLGNVSEWVWDWKGEYAATPAIDPRGPDAGDSRVIRGGSWYAPPARVRPAYRDWNSPERVSALRGFRLALPVAVMSSGKGTTTPRPDGGSDPR